MTVTCPSCRRALPASAINLERLLGKCDACNRLFDCSDQLPEPRHPGRAKLRREAVPLPEGMHIELTGAREGLPIGNSRREPPAVNGTLTITRQWFTSLPAVLRKVCFLIAWFASLGYWYHKALSVGAPLDYLIFPLLHVGVGLILFYRVLTTIFNSSTITANAEALTIRHGPLPARRNRRIPVAAIEQLYCKEVETKHAYLYEVVVRLVEGDEITLADRLPESDQALFIEEQIEAHLRIVDVVVEDEL
jgi:hypothetical protein